MLNNLSLQARTIAEPIVKDFKGSSLLTLRLVSSKPSKKDANGNWVNDPKTLFIDADLWKNGESKFFDMVATIPKGANIIVEGQLVGEEWVDKTTGQKRQKMKIAIGKIHFLDKKSDSTNAETEQADETDVPF